MNEPQIRVGILSATQLSFNLIGDFLLNGNIVKGTHCVTLQANRIIWQDQAYESLLLEPAQGNASVFELMDVKIGIDFHWERCETQRFRGALRIIVDEDRLIAINEIDVEDYLTCVISSEMSATASSELLKAHAVISRSWLLAQIERRGKVQEQKTPGFTLNRDTIVRWYDREDHTLFDVCADDHCQRYQGIGRVSTPHVNAAIAATRGELLYDDCNEICDARYSKCCGGVMEVFSTCWEEKDFSYLQARRDDIVQNALDLRQEAEAQKWIRTSPSAFCNTTDSRVLAQVLNHYDQETPNFYRWTVSYSQTELTELLWERSRIDVGQVKELNAIERGQSGRIKLLRIVGTKGEMTLGKELEIRRSLSDSHLYSSAFVVDTEDRNEEGVPARFVLHGAGWGHGVGLCQIGAALMGEKGYDYRQILAHYYPGALLKQAYI